MEDHIHDHIKSERDNKNQGDLGFVDFLKIYPICFVLGTMKISSISLSGFISEYLPNSVVLTEMPVNNENDYIIFSPKDNSLFDEIIHTKLTNRPFTKFPKGIVIVISFDNLVDMEAPFTEMNILNTYRIPILYCVVCDENTNYKIKLVKDELYNDSMRINDDENSLHITDPNIFEHMMKEKLSHMTRVSSKVNVYCYYNIDNLDLWKRKIKICEDIQQFYNNVLSTDGKMLTYENESLHVV